MRAGCSVVAAAELAEAKAESCNEDAREFKENFPLGERQKE